MGGRLRNPAPTEDRLRSSESIQGNVLAPFHKPAQAFLFVGFANQRDGARRWLAELVAGDRVASTNAVVRHAQDRHAARDAGLHPPRRIWRALGLTSSGLVTLQPELAADLFAYQAFWHGALADRPDGQGGRMAPAALLGDQAGSDPRRWAVGGVERPPVDALLTVAADDGLSGWADEEAGRARDHGLEVLEVRPPGGRTTPWQPGATLPQDFQGSEHFGFRDGISQPGVSGFTAAEFRNGRWEAREQAGTPIIAAGEFVLGYEGERGTYPGGGRPYPPAWMWDGSFQVFVRMTQDVAGWRRQLADLAASTGQDVAAKVVGRGRDGTPLAQVRGPGLNDFTYGGDPDGVRTPTFAHIRKMNPRDNLEFLDRTRRLLRRGIPFGPPLAEGASDDGEERGLLFNAFMASIEDQFEFVQRNWASNPRPYPARPGPGWPGPSTADGPDALTAAGDRRWLLRQEHGEPVELRFERFVRTTGAVYAFAPSLPTLRGLAAGEPLRG
jgi:Dyp-type peroxidase family